MVGLTFDEEDMQAGAREIRVRVPVGEEGGEEAVKREQMAEGRQLRLVLGRLGEFAVSDDGKLMLVCVQV